MARQRPDKIARQAQRLRKQVPDRSGTCFVYRTLSSRIYIPLRRCCNGRPPVNRHRPATKRIDRYDASVRHRRLSVRVAAHSGDCLTMLLRQMTRRQRSRRNRNENAGRHHRPDRRFRQIASRPHRPGSTAALARCSEYIFEIFAAHRIAAQPPTGPAAPLLLRGAANIFSRYLLHIESLPNHPPARQHRCSCEVQRIYFHIFVPQKPCGAGCDKYACRTKKRDPLCPTCFSP